MQNNAMAATHISEMTVQATCPDCGSSIEFSSNQTAGTVVCSICQYHLPVHLTSEHQQGQLKQCPICERKDFYQQKDFNRKLGVLLFVIAAIFSIWTYGITLIVLYLVDLFLFSRLGSVVVCYKCDTNFRHVKNITEIGPFDHEYNDRIKYADHDFQGKPSEL